jgi:hypothetical protein
MRKSSSTKFVMSRDASNEVFTYRPYPWVRIAIGVAFLIFAAITAIAIIADLKLIYIAVSVVMTAFALVGVIESWVSRVDVEPDTIAIKGVFKTERIALSQVTKVSADGGRIGVFMKTGKWKKLPEWLGANMSARRRIADRLGR